jgi:putative sterol carrier protein
MPHEFLSEDWFTAVEALRPEAPEPPAAIKDLVINLTVTGTPNGDQELRLDGGQLERGHGEGAPTTMTVPYDVAKQLFIQNDQAAAMQAFMTGKIKVTGDMTKLMAMQAAGPPTAEQQAFSQKLLELTD